MNLQRLCALLCAASLVPSGASAQQEQVSGQTPVITVDGVPFMSWPEYLESHQFEVQGLRCKLPAPEERAIETLFRPASDCTFSNTNPAPQYAPTYIIDVPVVVHVIMNTSGRGAISDAMVQSQIDILNEDFLAIAGSNGAGGTDTQIQFHLATVDPNGMPTTGITRSMNDSWFQDRGQYWNTLAWDTNRYMNIYTNQAGGALGYVPNLPQGGLAGKKSDRVVVLWSSFGLNGPIGPPFNKGRTATHEVGHYFGLEHTFTGGCATGDCYKTGDLICDTNSERSPTNGCPGNKTSCGSSDPVDNYMDYSNDLCMNMFTPEQTRRMRCSIEFYRPDLPLGSTVTAQAAVRIGSGLNPQDYASTTLPILGSNWQSTVAGTGNYQSVIIVSRNGPAAGPVLGVGELLVATPTLPFFYGNGSHSIAIPNDLSLLGSVFATQAATIESGVIQLTNAIDLTVGNQ